MLESLLNLVKENAGDAIINNNSVPNELNDSAVQTTSDSILESLKGQVSSGNISRITDLLRNGSQGNSGDLMSGISSNVISNLTSKLGIDSQTANGIATTLIPIVMSKLASKTNDPNDSSFDLQGIIGSLGGGSDLMGTISNAVGGDSKTSNSAGNMLNSVKGLFGN